MTTNSLHWENNLISLALEAQASHVPEGYQPLDDPFRVAPALLDQAYQYCAGLTRFHSRTFFMASGLLPEPKRKAVRALYAFCRVSDDLVDRPEGETRSRLEAWRLSAFDTHPGGEDAVALAWADTRQRFQIPRRYAEQLIDGVAQDLQLSGVQPRYQTFSELATYCYGVACTVGLMSMHIIGYASQDAIPYAVRLGVALQVTNILRDVGEDWRIDRVYLPQEELESFGLSEADLARGQVTPAWRQFMRFQIERARGLYTEALLGVALLDPDGRFAIRAAAELYQAILEDIETHDYDVFSRRASISLWGKLRRLPGIYWRSRR